jgi:hypothetical protein
MASQYRIEPKTLTKNRQYFFAITCGLTGQLFYQCILPGEKVESSILAAFFEDIEAHCCVPFDTRIWACPQFDLSSASRRTANLSPCCFAAEVRAMFLDAAVEDDDTPKSHAQSQAKHGATLLRSFFPGARLEEDFAWLSEARAERA